jgi:DNA-binding MarR family transcriptional regulator
VTDDTGAARKGRPRSPETIARDDAIMMLLRSGPKTRNALAARLGISKSLTSIAINRLKDAELIKRCVGEDGEPLWTSKIEEPCP